jgi:alpha-tubulin suppressor-like RCC1 family protein
MSRNFFSGFILLSAISLTIAVSPIAVSPMKVALGFYHSCAILPDATLGCWGDNENGVLALPPTDNRTYVRYPQVVDFGSGLTPTSVAVSDTRTCAIVSDGSVRCWGLNSCSTYVEQINETTSCNKLGIGYNTNLTYNTPQKVPLPAGLRALRLCMTHEYTCALMDDNTVKCWGDNRFNVLYHLSSTPSPPGPINMTIPTNITSGTDIIDLQCTDSDLYILTKAGTMIKLRESDYIEGTYILDPLTDIMTDIGNLTVISMAYGSNHLVNPQCYVLSDHSLRCWGVNQETPVESGDQGQTGTGLLGTGSNLRFVYENATELVTLPGNLKCMSVAVSKKTIYAVLSDGFLYSWGGNDMNLAGQGNITDTVLTSPRKMENMSNVVDIFSSYWMAGAQKADGSIWVWGLHAGRVGGTCLYAKTEFPALVDVSMKCEVERTTANEEGEVKKLRVDIDSSVPSFSIRSIPVDAVMATEFVTGGKEAVGSVTAIQLDRSSRLNTIQVGVEKNIEGRRAAVVDTRKPHMRWVNNGSIYWLQIPDTAFSVPLYQKIHGGNPCGYQFAYFQPSLNQSYTNLTKVNTDVCNHSESNHEPTFPWWIVWSLGGLFSFVFLVVALICFQRRKMVRDQAKRVTPVSPTSETTLFHLVPKHLQVSQTTKTRKTRLTRLFDLAPTRRIPV